MRAVYGKWAWLAGRRLAVDGGVLNTTAAGFHWWRSGNVKRTQNVSEYMLVIALCLVAIAVVVKLSAHISGHLCEKLH